MSSMAARAARLPTPCPLRKLKLLRTFVKHGFVAPPEKFAGDSRWQSDLCFDPRSDATEFHFNFPFWDRQTSLHLLEYREMRLDGNALKPRGFRTNACNQSQ